MIERDLSQCTPMIHFQAGEEGATLRATEVKPKLDRFIYRWCKKKGKEIKNTWLVEAKTPDKKAERHRALDYKLRFVAQGAARIAEPMKGLFFGNMGGEEKKTVFYEKPIHMTILCLHTELEKILEECVDLFFLTTNFGTRQNKGFGGFVTEKRQEAEGQLAWWFGTNRVYKLQYPGGTSVDKIMNDIRVIYQVLKSGINYCWKTERNQNYYIKSFLTQYFLQSDVGGEKQYLKDKKIGPVVYEKWNKHLANKHRRTPRYRRYIRALLGTCDTQTWFYDDSKKNYEKREITFESDKNGDESKLARVPSPILFKIINSTLYIMLVDIPSNVYGTKFSFTRYRIEKRQNRKVKVPEKLSTDADNEADRFLSIPSLAEMNEWGINMENILAEYIQALNGDGENDIRGNMQHWEERDKPKFISNDLHFVPVD